MLKNNLISLLDCAFPDANKLLIQQAVAKLRASYKALAAIKQQRQDLASTLPRISRCHGNVWRGILP